MSTPGAAATSDGRDTKVQRAFVSSNARASENADRVVVAFGSAAVTGADRARSRHLGEGPQRNEP